MAPGICGSPPYIGVFKPPGGCGGILYGGLNGFGGGTGLYTPLFNSFEEAVAAKEKKNE